MKLSIQFLLLAAISGAFIIYDIASGHYGGQDLMILFTAFIFILVGQEFRKKEKKAKK